MSKKPTNHDVDLENTLSRISGPLQELRESMNGRVILPDDPAYNRMRTLYYGGFDRQPALIARAADAGDVAHIISMARTTGLDLAVRSGGHSIAGHSVVDGSIVIDLREMKSLEIDPKNRTAWAQTGLTAGEYTTAAGKYGLATGFGDSGLVGIGGITLGGGIGYFARKYGLTIDDLLAAEIVTADGRILQIDEDHHPDLFWAIRGGGGNFGVATRFKYRLHEIDEVVGGVLMIPATPDRLKSMINQAQQASEDLSMMVNVMVAPPMPVIPAAYHGKLIIMAMLVHAGEIDDGLQAVERLRAIAPPFLDTLQPMKYPEIYPRKMTINLW